MGKASKRKKEAREARKDTVELRYAEHRCLHCGKTKPDSVWCMDCVLAGRRRGRARSWPAFKGPHLTENQIKMVCSLVNDKRWQWSGLVDGDLSHYDIRDQVEGLVGQEEFCE